MAYTISFFINGYGQQPENLTNITVLPELPILTEEGFIFDGWFIDEDLTIRAEVGLELTSDITLYAAWARDWNRSTGPNTYSLDPDKDLFDPTAPADFAYLDAEGNRFIDNWATAYDIPACIRESDPDTNFTLKEYPNFKDKNNNTLKGYVLPEWISDFTRVYGPKKGSNIYYVDGSVEGRQKLLGVKKGCLPLIKATDVSSKQFPGSSMRFTTSWKTNAVPNSYVGGVCPFYILGIAGSYQLVRYDDRLEVYQGEISPSNLIHTFSPGDFRDKVIPEYIYILLQGAGGGGGYSGGGGAGSWIGAVIDLKSSYTISLVVGQGGAVNSNGGDTYLRYFVNGGGHPGELRACGGKAGSSTGGAGGRCNADCIDHPLNIQGSNFGAFSSENYSRGGTGGDKGKNGGKAAEGEGEYDIVTLGNYSIAALVDYLPKEATHHFMVTPYLPEGGKSKGDGGGGGSSIFGSGGAGGYYQSSVAGDGSGSAYYDGHDGGIGAGGGGGYQSGEPGKGGNGLIELFY